MSCLPLSLWVSTVSWTLVCRSTLGSFLPSGSGPGPGLRCLDNLRPRGTSGPTGPTVGLWSPVYPPTCLSTLCNLSRPSGVTGYRSYPHTCETPTRSRSRKDRRDLNRLAVQTPGSVVERRLTFCPDSRAGTLSRSPASGLPRRKVLVYPRCGSGTDPVCRRVCRTLGLGPVGVCPVDVRGFVPWVRPSLQGIRIKV